MISLGLSQDEKRKTVRKALKKYKDVDRIFVFYGDKDQPDFDFDGFETVYTPYLETEMYRTFYPLLGQPYQGQNIPAITSKSLLVVDEFLVTSNRSDLKYNCTKHFLRVSDRRLVFNWFPILNDAEDFMVLADLDRPDVFKGHSFDEEVIKAVPDLSGVDRLPEVLFQPIKVTAEETEKYEKKKDELFETLGQKDPDTIPRNVQLIAGDPKKRAILPDQIYVARNARYKVKNIYTYPKCPPAEVIYILDMHYRFKDFTQFCRRTGVHKLIYMLTGFGVDNVYFHRLRGWTETIRRIYEKTGICR